MLTIYTDSSQGVTRNFADYEQKGKVQISYWRIKQENYFFFTRDSSVGFPGGSDCKNSACNAGDLGLIPGSGRFPGEGNGNPLQYSCLESSIDRVEGRLQSMGSHRVGHD